MLLHGVEMGQGPPVALLHGLFGQAGNFGTVQKALAAERRVIALDLRNHGASPHAPVMGYPAMAEDVLETLRDLRALPCALVGHSMGGKVAMQAAIEAPAAVARLVVSDIAPRAYPPGFRTYAAAMRALPPGLTRAEADRALVATVDDAGVRAFLLQNFRFGADPGWRIGLDAIAESLPAIEGFPAQEGAYPGPALFIAGGRSDYIRAEDRPAIRALFPAARFLTLKQAGHWVHADDPQGFTAALRAFLA